MTSNLGVAATKNFAVRRCAIYARYSSQQQDQTSIDDQIRECRRAIQILGWVVVEEFVLADEAKSGATFIGRNRFDSLREHAAQKTRQFDTIVMVTTSRMARNLSQSLPITDEMEYDGVGLYFVRGKLASWEPHFRDLFMASMRQDEKFLVGHGELVQQGHEGQVERGFVGSGRTYGYFNVPKEIPGTRTSYGRPRVEGVNMEQNPDEVAIIIRIFKAVAAGVGQLKLVLELNREGVPASLAYTGKKPRQWNKQKVSWILNNEKYIGVYIYKKRMSIRNPRTGKVEQVMRPREEWMIRDWPSLRIISDELWAAAHEKMEASSERFIKQKKGGLSRTSASRNYVFSGLLTCGCCGGVVNIVGGVAPKSMYGCHAGRYKGTCDNRRMIGQRRLQADLLSYLAANLSAPEFRSRIAKTFRRQLDVAVAEQARAANDRAQTPEEYERKRNELKRQFGNVIDSLQVVGPSPELKERYNSLKSQLDVLQPPNVNQAPAREFTEGEIEEFLTRKLSDLSSVLTGDLELAKQEMQQRITGLVLTPHEEAGERWYEVSGDLRLFAVADDVMLSTFSSKCAEHYNTISLPISLILGAKPYRAPYRAAA